MRYSGRISGWNDDRGFGFVCPNGGGDQAFVHVKALDSSGRRPVDGDLVSYEPTRDDKGRLNATRVRFAGRAPGSKSAAVRDWSGARIALAIGSLCVIGGAWLFAGLADIVLLAFVLMSILTFVAYGIDKSAARNDRRRTPESTLHILALLCGWPGALLAQALLRHKSRKASFQSVFRMTVVINVLILAWLVSGENASVLQGLLE